MILIYSTGNNIIIADNNLNMEGITYFVPYYIDKKRDWVTLAGIILPALILNAKPC